MKKLLLNGTALAGLALAISATPAAAEIQLGLGGHYSAYGIFADQDQDPAGRQDFDLQREGEIYFTGETTLDNGLTVGVEVQLEASSATADADTIDESYLYFSGNWGRVNVGSENGAAYLLQVGAPAVDANFDGIDPEYTVIDGTVANTAVPVLAGRGYSYGMGVDTRGDAERLTYLSPVFSGFQVGASYSPNLNEDAGTRAGLPILLAGQEDEYQIGARWAGDFDGVGVVLGAGWAQADGIIANTDVDQWNAGAQVNIAGFTVGAAYFNEDADVVGERDTWTAGVNYGFGPYTVGASYYNTENDIAGVTDEADRILVGGSYTYGPGLSFNGAVHFYDLDAAAPAAAPAGDNEATVVTLGTTVKF